MKIASVSHIKKELQHLSQEELIALCLRLAKFKKENKELLNYQLFLENDKDRFLSDFKEEIDESFESINRSNYHLMKKSIRRIFRETRKHIRICANKEMEVDMLLYLCEKLQQLHPSIQHNTVLKNLYIRTIDQLNKKVEKLHEDLQYDFNLRIEKLDE